MTERGKAISVLTANTVAFTVCFAAWMLNGVLVTYLNEREVYQWTESQIGWLLGIPVLTGSLIRLPLGILTDKYGGRGVFVALMIGAALPMFLLSLADSFVSFALCSFGFGIVGGSFAIGIAYTSVWFDKDHQGTALGIFGAGNAGSAITSLFAPSLLVWLTSGNGVEGWRMLPRVYAAALLVTAGLFWLVTYPKKVHEDHVLSLSERLAPLSRVRVWRFGLYYFLVFGGFVALAQWLIPYYVSAYAMSVTTAGLMASIFSLPSGVIRALGGWMSDHYGARRVMYWVLTTCLVGCLLLIVPRMNVELPGKSVLAAKSGTVTAVSETAVTVDARSYRVEKGQADWRVDDSEWMRIWPTKTFKQTPAVTIGQAVQKRQLLAEGVTYIHFQANVWIFTGIVFVVGFMMGIGKAAVYRYIPDYFPGSVGVVGGIVGVLGGLGGFVCPIIFGMLLERTGIWTTCWMFLALLAAGCLFWLHRVVQQMMHAQHGGLMRKIEHGTGGDDQPAKA